MAVKAPRPQARVLNLGRMQRPSAGVPTAGVPTAGTRMPPGIDEWLR